MSANAKKQFLDAYDREHATTMRVLRAYPKEKLELRPSPKIKTARELAWVFVLERGLGAKIWNDEFAKGVPSGGAPPKAPENWNDLLAAIDKASKDYRNLVDSASDAELSKTTHFLVGPKKLGEMTRLESAWFLLHDQIHHRGQFSIYLRMADGKLPSIYGPTADEQWI
jgi:uncharacterized damage-inducible protein DinB